MPYEDDARYSLYLEAPLTELQEIEMDVGPVAVHVGFEGVEGTCSLTVIGPTHA